MKKTLFLLILLFNTTFAQNYEVCGLINDKETGQPLGYASIRIDGTTRGTASNLDGQFSLKLDEGNYKLIFSYVGYKTDTLLISVPLNERLNINLQPDAVRLEEVVVNAYEDPAYRIIREAIKRKRENRKGLTNLEYNAYSKKIIKSAGEIAAIEETFVRGYNKINSWEKEFITSFHKTENQKKKASQIDITIADKYYIDFSRDTLSLMLNTVYLPLAHNAFDHYDYKLLEVTEGHAGTLYKIKVIPRSKIQPLLKGEITIESGMYALNSIELEINEGVRLPYVKNLSVKFVQQLGKYNGYWLPNYVEAQTGLEVSFQGLIGVERIEYDVINNITEYKINSAIPDSIENADKQKFGNLTINIPSSDSELTREEINEQRPIPLTETEIKAYADLDSSKTVEKMIKVTGTLSGLVPEPGREKDTTASFFSQGVSFLNDYLNIGNNRVSGIVIGPKYDGNIISKKIYTETSLGYSFRRKKMEGELKLNYTLKDFYINNLEVSFFHLPKHTQVFTPHGKLSNSLAVTLGFEDQFNYFLSTGYRFNISKKIGKNSSAHLAFISERQKPMNEFEYQSIFNTNRASRENYNIIEGTDNRLSLKFLFGKNPNDIQFIPENGLIAQIDFSNPAFKSNFNYKRIGIKGQIQTKTFYEELFIAPYLNFIFEAGLLTGNYGQQHLFNPPTALGVYSPQGAFKGLNPYKYTGTEMAALHVEHNWRTIPFQALGLNFISDLFIDFITGASALRMWNNSNILSATSQDKPYWEIYTGISKILGILRIDVCYNSLKNISLTTALGVVL